MAAQITVDSDLCVAAAGSVCETPVLHIASPRDAAGERGRDARVRVMLARGDLRDKAAERRDRSAEARSSVGVDAQAELDRDRAGRDRDAGDNDRADLLALLDERGVAGERPPP